MAKHEHAHRPKGGWRDHEIADKLYRVRRESTNTLVDSLRNHSKWLSSECGHTHKSSQDSHHPPEKSWDRGLGWDGTLAEIARGNVKQAQTVDDLVRQIEPQIRGKVAGDVKRWRWAHHGRRLNVGRFCAHDPNCLGRRVKARSRYGKVIRIGIGTMAPWHIDAKEFVNHAAFALAVATALEKRGFDVGLYAITKNRCNSTGRPSLLSVEVKKAGGHANPAKVAAVIGSPAYFRRVIFAAWEQDDVPDWSTYYGGGYGQSDPIEQSEAALFGLDVVIPSAWHWRPKGDGWNQPIDKLVEWFLATGWPDIADRLGVRA